MHTPYDNLAIIHIYQSMKYVYVKAYNIYISVHLILYIDINAYIKCIQHRPQRESASGEGPNWRVSSGCGELFFLEIKNFQITHLRTTGTPLIFSPGSHSHCACSVLQLVKARLGVRCNSVFQIVADVCRLLQCVAVCCSALQCAEVRCSKSKLDQ